MTIQNQILRDYENADKNGQYLLLSALSEILPFINYNEEKMFYFIDTLIEKKGKSIIKLSRKKDKTSCEKETYKMVLLNEYLNTFKFEKPRRIVLNFNPKDSPILEWNHKIEIEPKLINGKNLIFGLF